ncbi:hypothetical protein ACOME3_009551 [Neoechinorhynchus agilis]
MFDTYYQTKVNMRWGRSPAGIILGGSLFLLGLLALIFSSIDISRRSQTGVAKVNDTRRFTNIASDYSMWPMLGKGIWVGLFLMATGIIAICSQRERTSKAIAATTILAAISAILAFFLMLSAIPQLEFYRHNNLQSFANRSNEQNVEYTMNAILIAVGVIAFLLASLLACLGCLADACMDTRLRGPTGPRAPGSFVPPLYGRAGGYYPGARPFVR